jgi:tetratricopeptide (TPR) repeat protein
LGENTIITFKVVVYKLYMGLAYYGLGKFKEAIKAYEKVIEIEPNNNWAHYKLA